MNKRIPRSIVTAGALALAIAGGAPAFAHGMCGGGGFGHGAWAGRSRMLHALDLSADQKQRVQDILTAHRTTSAPLVANEKAAEQALADRLLGTGTATQQDLDALAEQESQARAALMHERLATALEVRSILTPNQIQKAATIHAGLKDLHARMRQLLGEQGGE